MSAPLRLGVLGAARISDASLLPPARELGVELVAVATRDRARSEAYAREHGIARVHDTYAEVIADALAGAPAAGFFAAGEIGPVGGGYFLHSFTATVAVFA